MKIFLSILAMLVCIIFGSLTVRSPQRVHGQQVEKKTEVTLGDLSKQLTEINQRTIEIEKSIGVLRANFGVTTDRIEASDAIERGMKIDELQRRSKGLLDK